MTTATIPQDTLTDTDTITIAIDNCWEPLTVVASVSNDGTDECMVCDKPIGVGEIYLTTGFITHHKAC
jgi:hypothetical protein